MPLGGQTSLDVGLVGGGRRKPMTKKQRKSLMRHTRKVKKAYKKFLKLARKYKMRGGGNIDTFTSGVTISDGDYVNQKIANNDDVTKYISDNNLVMDTTNEYDNSGNPADASYTGDKYYKVNASPTPAATSPTPAADGSNDAATSPTPAADGSNDAATSSTPAATSSNDVATGGRKKRRSRRRY